MSSEYDNLDTQYPVPTELEIVEQTLQEMRSRGLPTDSWTTRTGYMAIVAALAFFLHKLYVWSQAQLKNLYLNTAQNDAILMLADNFYGVTRAPATDAILLVTLEDTGGQGPFTIKSGCIVQSTVVGLQYRTFEDYYLEQNGTVDIQVRANQKGAAYNLVDNATEWRMVTPYLGVTVVPGGAFVQYGQDVESYALVKGRCRSKLYNRTAGRVSSSWEFIVKALEETVVKVASISNPDGMSGHVRIVVAGSAGVFAATGDPETDVVLRLNTSLQDFKTMGTTIDCVSATETKVLLSGTVYVLKSFLNDNLKSMIKQMIAEHVDAKPINSHLYRSNLETITEKVDGVRNVVLLMEPDVYSGQYGVFSVDTSGLEFLGV